MRRFLKALTGTWSWWWRVVRGYWRFLPWPVRTLWVAHRTFWSLVGLAFLIYPGIAFVKELYREYVWPYFPTSVSVARCELVDSGTVWVVGRNDATLGMIALSALKNIDRWQAIVELNEERYPSLRQNPDYLQQGWTL